MEEFLDEQALFERQIPEKKLEYHYENHSQEDGQDLQQTLLDIDSLLDRILEPGSGQKEDILKLHALVGNQKVQQLLDVESLMPFAEEIAFVNTPTYYDRYEKEADEIAENITQSGSQSKEISLDKAPPTIRRSRKISSAITPSANISRYLSQTKNQGQSLPEKTRLDMEQKLGTDLQKVRIHSDRSSYQASRELGAKAFTYGSHIYFAARQYNTSSQQGQKLLAHELVHTVQQRKQPTIQAKLNFSQLFQRRKKLSEKQFLALKKQAKSMRQEIRTHAKTQLDEHEDSKKELKKEEQRDLEEIRRQKDEEEENKKEERREQEDQVAERREEAKQLAVEKKEERDGKREDKREESVARGVEKIDEREKTKLERAEQQDLTAKTILSDVVRLGIHAVPLGRQSLLQAERRFEVHPKKYSRENVTKVAFQEEDIARGGNYSFPHVVKSTATSSGQVRGPLEKIKAKIRFHALRARARIRKEKIPSKVLKAFRATLGYRKNVAKMERGFKAKKKELKGKAKAKLKEKGNQLRDKLNQSKGGRMAVKAFDGVRGYRKNINKATKKASAKKKELKGKAKAKISEKGNQLRDKLNQSKGGRMAVKGFDGVRNYRKNINKATKKVSAKKKELKGKAKAKISEKGNQLRDKLNQSKGGRMAVKGFDGVRNYRKNINKASRKVSAKKKELKGKAKAKISEKGNQLRDKLNQGKGGRMAVKGFDGVRNYRKNINKASRKISAKKKELKNKAKAKISEKGNMLRDRMKQSERGRKALEAFDFARNYRKNINRGEKKLRTAYKDKKRQVIDKVMGRETKPKEEKPPRVDKYKQYLEEQAQKKMEKLKEEDKLSQSLRLKAESGELKDEDVREASKKFDLYPPRFFDIFKKRADLLTSFIAFCEKEQNQKLFHFYSDYSLYRKKPDLGVALKIYKAYVKEGAKEKVDLNDKDQKDVEKILGGQVDQNAFKESKKTLFSGMSRSAFKEIEKVFEKYKTDFEVMKVLVLRDLPTRLKDRNSGLQVVRSLFANAILKEDPESSKEEDVDESTELKTRERSNDIVKKAPETGSKG